MTKKGRNSLKLLSRLWSNQIFELAYINLYRSSMTNSLYVPSLEYTVDIPIGLYGVNAQLNYYSSSTAPNATVPGLPS